MFYTVFVLFKKCKVVLYSYSTKSGVNVSNVSYLDCLTIKPTAIFPCNTSGIYSLKGKAGVYSFVNKTNGKQYIGSSEDLYVRLRVHLSGNVLSSNIYLQRALKKYGTDGFQINIYEYLQPHLSLDKKSSSVIESNDLSKLKGASLGKKLLDLETIYINSFPKESLYNICLFPSETVRGYRHTEENKLLLSTQQKGELNHMFGKKHTELSKLRMSLGKNKLLVGLYDKNNILVMSFNNTKEAGAFLGIHRTTVTRHINSGNLWVGNNRQYFIRRVEKGANYKG